VTVTAYAISQVRSSTVRITKVDNCGNVVSGAGGMWVGTGHITVKGTKNMNTGTEVKVSNANDVVVVYEPGKRTLLNYNLEVDFAVADTSAIQLVTGDTAVTDANPATAGWVEQGLQPLPNFFALEAWVNLSGQQCAVEQRVYGYHLWPFLGNGYVDMDDIQNKEIDFKLMANSFFGTNWGKGPYDVVSSSASSVIPAWLASPLPATAHKLFMVTTVAPPTPAGAAGLQVLTPVSS
jgi:hypothetical protein